MKERDRLFFLRFPKLLMTVVEQVDRLASAVPRLNLPGNSDPAAPISGMLIQKSRFHDFLIDERRR
jgi:hypothetical protein